MRLLTELNPETILVGRYHMINKFPYYQIKKMISREDIARLYETYNEIKLKDDYLCGHASTSQLRESEISRFPEMDSLLKKVRHEFEQIIGSSAIRLMKLWLVSSNHSSSNPDTLPYITHFDKRRSLKAMVYLHDVTIEHGPIHLGRTKDNVNIEKRRQSLPKDYKQHGLNLISNDEIKGSLSPVLGQSGDVIFFDTNMPHKAGLVSEGFKREVLRFDFEDPKHNNSRFMFNIKSLTYKFRIMRRIKK